jgi:hypothetical protein
MAVSPGDESFDVSVFEVAYQLLILPTRFIDELREE